MHNFVRSCAAGLLAFTLGAPAMAQDPSPDTVVARVNGTEITLGHLIIARSALPDQYQTLANDFLLPRLIDQLVQQAALAESIRGEESLATSLAIENEINAYLASDAAGRAARDAVTEEALQDAYEATYAGSEGEVEFNASHILVASEAEAQELLTMLDEGADFAELARVKSTGPSGPNGGQLGWFGAGMMVPTFEAAVRELDIGGVSAPVQTQFGWHVILLNDKRVKSAPPIEEVEGELRRQIESAAVEARVQEALAEAEIERLDFDFDPDQLMNLGLITE